MLTDAIWTRFKNCPKKFLWKFQQAIYYTKSGCCMSDLNIRFSFVLHRDRNGITVAFCVAPHSLLCLCFYTSSTVVLILYIRIKIRPDTQCKVYKMISFKLGNTHTAASLLGTASNKQQMSSKYHSQDILQWFWPSLQDNWIRLH